MYSPYPAMQRPYQYAQEMNPNEQEIYPKPHHRRTNVDVDVVGKREAPISDEPAAPKSKTHFLA
jgi:hypothetical protein